MVTTTLTVFLVEMYGPGSPNQVKFMRFMTWAMRTANRDTKVGGVK